MALTEYELRQMLSMDDESLKRLILMIAKAAGGDEGKAASLTSDIPSLKNLMSRLTPAEAEELLGRAGKGRSEDIYRIINNRNGGK
ncbi:MAG: hypothetical protein PHW77_05210 [Eubacteriales bacterium]|nr:hypothetical protein [Eubacteriales bacterium]